MASHQPARSLMLAAVAVCALSAPLAAAFAPCAPLSHRAQTLCVGPKARGVPRGAPASGVRAARASAEEEEKPKRKGLQEFAEGSTQRVVRSQISAADMLEMQRMAAESDPRVASQRRRNVVLAAVSPLVGAGLFAYQKSQPQDPLALLRKMEAASPPIEVALKNGKPTVIEFYASWCKDCKEMAPQMVEFEKKYGGSGDINFVVLDAEKDSNARLVDIFKVDAIPHFAMVSGEQKLLTTLTGYFPKKIFDRQFEALKLGEQLPYCGPDRCYLEEKDGVQFKKGDRDS